MKAIDPTLFPEIAEFWADAATLPALKDEIIEANSNVVCTACPECQWMAKDRLRAFCRTQHTIVFPLSTDKGLEEDRDNVRMPIRICSTLNGLVSQALKAREEDGRMPPDTGIPDGMTFAELLAGSTAA